MYAEKIILLTFFSLTCLQASELSADPILPSTLEEISRSERKVIACFGGSVTEQAHGNGYVGALAELMPEYEIRRFGYGGRSLFPAGINHIDELLECRPSLILMAWSLLETDEPHSEAIIKVLLKKAQNSGANVVFMHTPRRDGLDTPTEHCIDRFADELNYSVLDLRSRFSNAELAEGIGDAYHTNPIGAKMFARAIKEFLSSTLSAPLKIPHRIIDFSHYECVKKLTYAATIKKISFSFNGSYLSLDYTVGPYSNFIELSHNEESLGKIQTWDKWCHYERNTETVLLDQIDFTGGKVTINTLNEKFDRSESTRPRTKKFWDSHEPCLKLRGFYYIGEIKDIEVEDQRLSPSIIDDIKDLIVLL